MAQTALALCIATLGMGSSPSPSSSPAQPSPIASACVGVAATSGTEFRKIPGSVLDTLVEIADRTDTEHYRFASIDDYREAIAILQHADAENDAREAARRGDLRLIRLYGLTSYVPDARESVYRVPDRFFVAQLHNTSDFVTSPEQGCYQALVWPYAAAYNHVLLAEAATPDELRQLRRGGAEPQGSQRRRGGNTRDGANPASPSP